MSHRNVHTRLRVYTYMFVYVYVYIYIYVDLRIYVFYACEYTLHVPADRQGVLRPLLPAARGQVLHQEQPGPQALRGALFKGPADHLNAYDMDVDVDIDV